MLRITRCISLTSSLLIFSLTSSLCYIISDPAGYDDKKLYGYIKYALGIALVCPVKRYKKHLHREA
jgi:hypothetical protein